MKPKAEPRRVLTALNIAVFACGLAMTAFGVGKLSGALDPLVARRGVGAMLGLMLMATGNFVPRLRLFEPAMGTAHSDAIDRFAGWIFVACGMAFAVVFLLAPADAIMLASPLIVLAGFLAVFGRWLMWKGTQPSRPAPRLTQGRLLLAIMLGTVFWTCAIFIADVVWGDSVSLLMGMLFPLAAVPLIVFLVIKLAKSHHA